MGPRWSQAEEQGIRWRGMAAVNIGCWLSREKLAKEFNWARVSSGQEGRLRNPAGQRRRLLHPRRHLCLVEIVLMDIDPARVLACATGWGWPQRRTAEKVHLDVAGEGVE